MLGTKERQFVPLGALSLEDLVPADHFYRHLDRTLDLSFVRALVAPCYAARGRPSIDPVVFFRLQLVMFFEDIRSERLLMRTLADRLAARWYIGYDFGEALPERSSLSKIRQRYGLEVFRRFFDAIVARCQAAGLVWGRELYIDATKVVADASVDSITPRFAVAARAHVEDIFAQDAEALGPPGPAPAADDAASAVAIMPASGADALAMTNAARHDWIAAAGRQDRSVANPRYLRTGDIAVSTTDPDATHLRQRDGVRLGYQAHYLVDGGWARIILGVLVTPTEVPEDWPAADLTWRARFRWHLWPRQATGDKAYGTLRLIRALEDQHLHAYIPLPDFDARTTYFGKREFTYDPVHDVYTCPHGQTLRYWSINRHTQLLRYRADAQTCAACPLKARCTPSTQGREVSRGYDEAYFDRVRAYQATAPYRKTPVVPLGCWTMDRVRVGRPIAPSRHSSTWRAPGRTARASLASPRPRRAGTWPRATPGSASTRRWPWSTPARARRRSGCSSCPWVAKAPAPSVSPSPARGPDSSTSIVCYPAARSA